MADNGPMNKTLWKTKAMAFVTRAHRHLWGKNSEDPLVFLFRQGLSTPFAKDMQLGWNKHGQERERGKWGVTVTQEKESHFFLPPGIVFPYILEKELTSILIQPLDPAAPWVVVPGSSPDPILMGNPENPRKTAHSLIQALQLFQEKNKTWCIHFQP